MQQLNRYTAVLSDDFYSSYHLLLNTQPSHYTLKSRRSNLSLVDVNERKAINIVFKFGLNFKQFYAISTACSGGLMTCNLHTIHHTSLSCKLSCAVKFKSFILKIRFLQMAAFLFV